MQNSLKTVALIVSLGCLAALHNAPPNVTLNGLAAANDTKKLADASEARMIRADLPIIKDHYGNPALFEKYIIRRPQVRV
ncbi:MAG: hypothetical protein QNL99_03655 [SAR86 cluster bacterium]|jgi:hypothetical protein|nr:hypothetical protein [Porticoccaceae bacterium]|tara:strand:+ start:20096 stop:20335 length:240 start_codon:yes stop_codon:yes gene_type:complete